MRAIVTIAALLALCPQDQTPTFRATTRVMALTVTRQPPRQPSGRSIFAERSANGRTRLTTNTPTVKIPDQSWETAQREGLRYARRLKPARDAVSLRVIVRDMLTGRYGILDVPLRTLPVR